MVEVHISETVYELKKRVKMERTGDLTRLHVHVDPDRLTVWKPKGEMVIEKSTSKTRMAEILKSIDANDMDVIEEVDERGELRDIELPNGQVLLVKLPGLSRIPTAVGCVLIQAIGNRLEKAPSLGNVITSKVIGNSNYKVLFLRAMTRGKFTSDDVALNEITYMDSESKGPKFVKDLEKSLGRRRSWIKMLVVFISYDVFDI